jgi:hypothetical protein
VTYLSDRKIRNSARIKTIFLHEAWSTFPFLTQAREIIDALQRYRRGKANFIHSDYLPNRAK